MHFPLVVDGRGEVADADQSLHVRQLIEQVLFTEPGERVNRPDFGCGLLRTVFGAPGPEEMIALQFMVRTALEQWLGELIETRDVSLEHLDNVLHVRIEYVDKTSRRPETASYEVSPA